MADLLPVATDVTLDKPKSVRIHTVFVDTSLDTHIAMAVEEFDTVADFKKRIKQEHGLCFPEIGDISVNALQVKRRGFLYHLSDSMYVKNAFEGIKSRWFVYVDACSLVNQGLEISGKGNGILHLEHNVMKDRIDERINAADKFVRNLQTDESLNRKTVGDVVMKVIEDLEIDCEQMGDDHFRISSSEINKRVEIDVDRGNIPNDASGKVRESKKKRKMVEFENSADRNLLNGNFSSGHENEAITAKKRRKSEKKDKSSKRSSTETNKSTVDASVEDVQNGDTIEQMKVTNSCVNKAAMGMLCDSYLDGDKALHSAPTTDGKLEYENRQIKLDPTHVSPQLIGPTNVLLTGENALDPCSANEISSMTEPAAATVSEVHAEKKEPSTKRKKKKKKKTKSEILINQLHKDVPVPSENNVRSSVSQFTDSAGKVNLKISETQSIEDALLEKKQFSTGQTSSRDKNTSLPEIPEKMSNVSHLRLDKKTDELVERYTADIGVMDSVICANGLGQHVVKQTEANPEAPQLKRSIDLIKPVAAVEQNKKSSKQKRKPSSNSSEIHVHEKVGNPSQSTRNLNSQDKSIGADKGEIENAEKNNCNKGTLISTSTVHVPPVEGKRLDSVVWTNPLVDGNTKDNIISSHVEEINFSAYLVPNQQKPSGDDANVNDEGLAVKGTTVDLEVKKKSAAVHDGMKSQVGSSQESLSILQPHGVVLHSDTESFRVSEDRKPSASTGGKQKLKSKSKQITSEIATTLHSPRTSETQKLNASHKAAESKVAAQHQSKENTETTTASNSTPKSPAGVHRSKSKKPASRKSSTPKVNNAENSANRRKTLLSANIFKDDNDESSEDEEAVTSVHSAGTFMEEEEDTNASDISEMEDNTGIGTPVTVGQRKAAEVDNELSQNKYTLEKLRETARLEKAKRAQELGIPLEEFIPDIQVELIE